MNTKKRACITGAGSAGLCALKNCLENGFETVCYEKSTHIGGTWILDDKVESVELEDDVQSSMYEGLRTNLPKEVMGYPDFSYKDDEEVSFVTSERVVEFLEQYAEHFKLKEHIKFKTEVIRVRPRIYSKCNESFWEVYIKDIETDSYSVELFDFIFVCNGHHTLPAYPDTKGLENFKGKKMHSHLYRKASNYKDERILIIGAGPSGMDLAFQLNGQAEHVYLSHCLNQAPCIDCLENVTLKPVVEHFTETGAVFEDGTVENFSMILCCTGYRYSFPFLSVDCGIHLAENFVEPLYKHVINIKYPTMAIIGLTFKTLTTLLFDLQVRFALKFFLHEKCLPSREEMLNELAVDIEERKQSGVIPTPSLHELDKRQFNYYRDLAETADIEPLKPVICKIMKDCGEKFIFELENYRDYCFKILDDENFIKYKSEA